MCIRDRASLYVLFILLQGQCDLKMLKLNFQMIFVSDLAINSSISRNLVHSLLSNKFDLDKLSEQEKSDLFLHGIKSCSDSNTKEIQDSCLANDFIKRHHFMQEKDTNLFSIDEFLWIYELLSNWIGDNYYLESETNLIPIYHLKVPNFCMGKINNVYEFLQKKEIVING